MSFKGQAFCVEVDYILFELEKTVDILNRPVTRSSVILNKSFHPNLDNRFYLGKTAGKETN